MFLNKATQPQIVETRVFTIDALIVFYIVRIEATTWNSSHDEI